MHTRRTCICGEALPYGDRRQYHTRRCRSLDTPLLRCAREAGVSAGSYLSSVLTQSGSITAAALRLGVDTHTVRRWMRRHGVRERRLYTDGGPPVVYVALRSPARRRRPQREQQGQRTLMF